MESCDHPGPPPVAPGISAATEIKSNRNGPYRGSITVVFVFPPII